MSAYQVKYNKSSYHIAGIVARTEGTQMNYSLSACPALTRGANRMATGLRTDDLAEALRGAELSAKVRNARMCSKCREAAEIVIANS